MPLSPAHSEGLSFSTGARGRVGRARRPLLGLTLAVLAGLMAGAFLEISLPILLAACWLLGVLVLATLRRTSFTAALHALVLALACLHTALIVRNPSPAELSAVMRRDREFLRLVAVITDDPVQEPARRGDAVVWRFPARVEGVQRAVAWQHASGRLDVRWETTNTAATIQFGERWLLAGPALRLPAAPAAPAVYRLEAGERDATRLDGGHGSRLRAACLAGRRACAGLLSRGIEDFPETVGLARALMLGYRQELPQQTEDAFRSTGTLHIVAISGAHVGMVALFFLVALKATGCPQHRWILVLGPLLVVYALSTGMAASAVRACIMAITFWSAYLFRRQPDAPSALAFAALLILAWEPAQLWEAGFLLSFGVVGGLVLLYPVLVRPLHALTDRDPWKAQVDPRWRRWLLAGLRAAGSLVAVTVAAWLVSTPMIAYFFNLFSPVALVANLVVVPLAFVILLAGCLAVVFGAIHPLLAEIFNHADHVFVTWLLQAVEFFNRWPSGHWYVEAPPRWAIAVWLACVGALFLGRRRLRWTAAAVAGVALLVGLGRYATDHRIRLETTVLGPAHVVFCNLPGGNDLLIDTGPSYMNRRLLRFLRAQGVDHLHALVLSRASVGAGGGAVELCRRLPVEEVWVPDVTSHSTAFAQLIDELAGQGVKIRTLARGDRGYAAGDLFWEVLHPARGGEYRTAARGGFALRLARGPTSVLFMSQPTRATEDELLGASLDLGASALIVGSLSDGQALGAAWLDATRPSDVVLPALASGPADTSVEDVRDRLRSAGVSEHSRVEGVVSTLTFAPPHPTLADPILTVSTRELPGVWR